jgi:MFS family permease
VIERVDARDVSSIRPLTGRRAWTIVSGLLLVALLGSLDQTVVSTALPTIVGDLGGATALSAVVTSYLVASTLAAPVWGRLGDRHGRKWLLLVGIVIFIGGSVLSGQSRSMTELVVFRALQGAGGGGLLVGAQAVVGDIVSARERAKYLSLFSAVFSVISVLGPLVGGVVTDQLGWRWIFYLTLPIAVVALVVLGSAMPGRTARTGAGAPSAPLASRELLRNRTFVICVLISLVSGFVVLGITIYLPLFLQVVRGVSPTASGLQLVPLVVSGVVASLGSGFLIARRGQYKIFPLVGAAAVTIGLLLLSLVGPDTPTVSMQACLITIGAGLGCIGEVLIVVAQESVPDSQVGTATATMTVFRSVGGVLGTAVLGAAFAGALTGGLGGLPVVPGIADDMTPARLAQLPAAARHEVVAAYSSSIQDLLLIAAPAYAVVFGLVLLMPDFDPRHHARGR